MDDAGHTPEPTVSALPQAELDALTDQLVEKLKTVFDPEIPVDIYELGLIYKVDVSDDKDVVIDMTLTAPRLPGGRRNARMGARGGGLDPRGQVLHRQPGFRPPVGPLVDVRRGETRTQHVLTPYS